MKGGRLVSVVAMEASHPVSIDSFSYSWLVNLKPALENLDNSFGASLDASDDASFIEMDPKMSSSKRFFGKSQDFMFDFPVSPSALDFVHADMLISNGYLMPLFFEPFKMETFEESDFVLNLADSSHAADVDEDGDSDCSLQRKYGKLPKHILQKYFNFLTSLCRRISGVRRSSKAGEFGRRCRCLKNLKQVLHSSETSPQMSIACSINDRRRASDSDSSIFEAVLHCKRSIGK